MTNVEINITLSEDTYWENSEYFNLMNIKRPDVFFTLYGDSLTVFENINYKKIPTMELQKHLDCGNIDVLVDTGHNIGIPCRFSYVDTTNIYWKDAIFDNIKRIEAFDILINELNELQTNYIINNNNFKQNIIDAMIEYKYKFD